MTIHYVLGFSKHQIDLLRVQNDPLRPPLSSS
jgi:hypothetical protein